MFRKAYKVGGVRMKRDRMMGIGRNFRKVRHA
jgi:hypothetical protein